MNQIESNRNEMKRSGNPNMIAIAIAEMIIERKCKRASCSLCTSGLQYFPSWASAEEVNCSDDMLLEKARGYE